MAASYSIVGITGSDTFSNDISLIQLKSGTKSLHINYLAVDGNSLTAAAVLDVGIARITTASTTMTDFTPLPLDANAAAAKAVGADGTGVWLSGQGEATYAAPLWRRQVSTQAGGGLEIWFPPEMISIEGGGATTTGIIGVKIMATLAAAAALTYTLIFTET